MLHTRLLSSVSLLVVLAVSMPAAGAYFQTFKVDADDAQSGAAYGQVTAVDGNIAVVGAHKFDGNDQGKAYLVDVTTGEQLAELPNPDAGNQDYFGYAVDIDGNTVAVGAARKNNWTGAAYLYNITDPTAPTLTASLTNPGSGNVYGHDVAVSGSTAIVGSRGGNNAFLYNASTGDHLGTLSAAGSGDFGRFVTLDGNIAAVTDGDSAGENIGAVHLFDVSTPAAPVPGAVLSPGSSAYGTGIDISGNMGVFTAPNQNGGLGEGYLYDLTDIESPIQVAQLVPSDGGVEDSNFGYSAGIDGSAVVVGRRDDTAWVYDLNGIELQTLTPSDGDAGAGFGAQGVSIDGRIVVGAWDADAFDLAGDPVSQGGAVYVFAVPEPSSLILLTIGAAGLLGFGWRRRRS